MRLPRPNGPSIKDDAAVVPIMTVSVVAEAAVKVQVDSEGRPVHAKLGAVANPPSKPKVMVPEPLWPGAVTVMANMGSMV